MHVKNIKNVKLNDQIFKIYKKNIYKKFEEFSDMKEWNQII